MNTFCMVGEGYIYRHCNAIVVASSKYSGPLCRSVLAFHMVIPGLIHGWYRIREFNSQLDEFPLSLHGG